MSAHLRLAEQLCTRLCHDLTGPIGAVSNGAEFLAEEGFSNLQSQALELINSSAFSAVARLQFYRVAYGRVKESGEASVADHQKLAKDYFEGSKIVLEWPDAHGEAAGVSLSTRMMRLLFNLLVIASASLLKGGALKVEIVRSPGGEVCLRLTASGEAVKWDKDVEQVLMQGVDTAQVSPKNVQQQLTHELAGELGAVLSFAADAQNLSITAVKKG